MYIRVVVCLWFVVCTDYKVAQKNNVQSLMHHHFATAELYSLHQSAQKLIGNTKKD